MSAKGVVACAEECNGCAIGPEARRVGRQRGDKRVHELIDLRPTRHGCAEEILGRCDREEAPADGIRHVLDRLSGSDGLQANRVGDRKQILDPVLKLPIDDTELIILLLEARQRLHQDVDQNEIDARKHEEKQKGKNIIGARASARRIHPVGAQQCGKNEDQNAGAEPAIKGREQDGGKNVMKGNWPGTTWSSRKRSRTAAEKISTAKP